MQHILEKYGYSPVEDATTKNDMLMRSIVIQKSYIPCKEQSCPSW